MRERELRKSVRMDDKHSSHAFELTVSLLLFIALPYSHSQPPLCAQQLYRCNWNVFAIFDPPWEKIAHSQCNGPNKSSLLNCHAHHESQNFTVKDIDNPTHTMKVMPRPPVNHVCSPHFFLDYENFNNTLFLYNASVHKIIIFKDCPTTSDFPSKRKFKCGDDVYYFEEEHNKKEMLDNYPLLEDCKGRFDVPAADPLDRYDDTGDGAGVLEEALSDAFEVKYGIPDGCTRCRETDRSCLTNDYGYGYSEWKMFV